MSSQARDESRATAAAAAPGSVAAPSALPLVAIAMAGAMLTFALVSLLLTRDDDLFRVPNGSVDPSIFTLVLAACFGVAGLLVAVERPDSPVGWLLLASGLMGSLSEVLGIYGTRALTEPEHGWPLGLAAIWAAGWLWLPAFSLPFTILPQVYPDGHVVGPRWRWPLWLSVLAIASATTILAASPENVDDYVAGARLPITWPQWAAPIGLALGVVGFAGIVGGVLAGAAGLAVRYRRGDARVKGQIPWLAVPALLGGVTMFTPLSWLTLALWYPLIPVAVAIGVLGYELLGIHVTMRRLLVYLPLTLLIALLVGGVTTVIAHRSAGTLSGALITACVIALVIMPLRDVLMRLADRLLYGRAREPLVVIDQLGATDAGDPQALLAALARSMRSPGIAMRDGDGEILAQHGRIDERAVAIPLSAHGVTGGSPAELLVSPRRGEHTLDSTDARLLGAVTPHLAAAMRAQALAEEVEAERARVVAATDSERARLRRDLHDGLGPALSGIALGAEAAATLVHVDPDAAADLLRRLQAGASQATEEVRRVIDDLRPTALDAAPLDEAVRMAAARVPAEVAVLVSGTVDSVPPDVADTVYRIAAEALTNVARHSGATACRVELDVADGLVVLRVRDDGCGVPGGDHGGGARGNGVGMESMQRRAATLGGTVRINRTEPTGTEVIAMLPWGTVTA